MNELNSKQILTSLKESVTKLNNMLSIDADALLENLNREPADAEPTTAAPSYHNRIMNVRDDRENGETEFHYAFRDAFRTARHAAAEIASEADARITELETQLADLRDFAYNRAPKLAAEKADRQTADLRAQLAEAKQDAARTEARADATEEKLSESEVKRQWLSASYDSEMERVSRLIEERNAAVRRFDNSKHAESQRMWKSLQTAPKDGTAILLLKSCEELMFDETVTHPAKVAIGHWWAEGAAWVPAGPHKEDEIYTLQQTGVWLSGGGWFQPDEVTHWMPLPSPNPDWKVSRKKRARWRTDKIHRQAKQILDLVEQRDAAVMRAKTAQEAFDHFTNPGWEGHEALEAENARLRAALERLEWSLFRVGKDAKCKDAKCPVCFHLKSDGKHADDCFIAAALSPDARPEALGRECPMCGGGGWTHHVKYGAVACAECNDDGRKPKPAREVEAK